MGLWPAIHAFKSSHVTNHIACHIAVQARYARGAIYTYTGTILIAVNPFQPIPELVKPGVMQAYQQLLAGHSVLQPPNREAATLAPHVHVRFFDDRP